MYETIGRWAPFLGVICNESSDKKGPCWVVFFSCFFNIFQLGSWSSNESHQVLTWKNPTRISWDGHFAGFDSPRFRQLIFFWPTQTREQKPKISKQRVGSNGGDSYVLPRKHPWASWVHENTRGTGHSFWDITRLVDSELIMCKNCWGVYHLGILIHHLNSTLVYR